MDEHEVPTHVQAEDRVLLWFTFPQIVALTAVAALAYGVYQVAPFGPEAVRIGLGLVFALVGIALIVGRVGGRRLPAVAADLMRFGFGPRRFSGPPVQLVRAEPPAPAGKQRAAESEGEPAHAASHEAIESAGVTVETVTQQAASGPGPIKRGARKLANLKRSPRPRTRGERMPFKPRNWFRKRDRRNESKREYDDARQAIAREQREHRSTRWPRLLGGAAALAVVASVVVCCPPLASADEGEEEAWTSDEIEFDPPPLIPGRRLFIERLTVTANAATVVLKAAANLEVEVRAFGGPDGREPKFQRENTLGRGGRSSYLMPLDGPVPSFTFSWRDEHGQAGALSLAGDQLPYPLPAGPRGALRPRAGLARLAHRRREWPDRGRRALGLRRDAGGAGRAADRSRPRRAEPDGLAPGAGDPCLRDADRLGRRPRKPRPRSCQTARPGSGWRCRRRRESWRVEITADLTADLSIAAAAACPAHASPAPGRAAHRDRHPDPSRDQPAGLGDGQLDRRRGQRRVRRRSPPISRSPRPRCRRT